MSDTGWTAERIAEARRRCRERTDVYLGDFPVQAAEFLSLLDELERVTRERDEAKEALVPFRELLKR